MARYTHEQRALCHTSVKHKRVFPFSSPETAVFWSLCLETRGRLQIKPNCCKDENGAFPFPRREQARIGSFCEDRSRECAKFLALRSLGKMKQFPTFPKRVTTLARYPDLSQSPRSVARTGQKDRKNPSLPR